MSLFKSGTFSQRTGTGSQTITGVGFTPKVLILWTSGNSTLNGHLVSHTFGFGFTDGTRQDTQGGISIHGISSSTTNRCSHNTRVFRIVSAGASPTTVDLAEFTSFNSDGFVLNWLVNAGNERFLNYICLGGDDLSAKQLLFTSRSGTAGTQAITGAGFEPDCVLFLSAGDANLPPAQPINFLQSFGFATASDQSSAGTGSQSAQSTANTHRYQRTDRCITNVFNNAVFLQASLQSMDADGFTLDWQTVQSTGRRVIALCLKGGQYKIGHDTMRATTGTKAVTGMGFQPKGILFQAYGQVASTSLTDTVHHMVGAADPSHQSVSSFYDSHGLGTMNVGRWHLSGKCFVFGQVSSATIGEGEIDSFDSDGFTVNWTKVDSPERQFLYLAFGDAPAGDTITSQARVGRRTGIGSGFGQRR